MDRDNEVSVAAHMEKVLAVLIESYPHSALQKLEEVSYLVRKGRDLSKFLTVQVDKDYRQQARDLAEHI